MKPSIIPAPRHIVLNRNVCRSTSVCEEYCRDLGEEAYRLSVTSEGITIFYGDAQGKICGQTTLRQLRQQYGNVIPCMEVEDQPALHYRSFHIDCARHFFPLDELKKMIEMAAYFKFNRFRWHFSDDQGWRIESKAFPRLHEIGAYRTGDHFGNYSSNEPEGGYYTRDEVRELVAFCRERGIEIVPDVDIPGHAKAILAAYPELSCTGETVEVETKPGIFREILCAGKEDVYTFLETLLDDLQELFPGEYFHIGGDETPKGQWRECPRCQAKMKAEGLISFQQLQGYMNNRIAAYLARRGRKAICWNEAANGDNLDTAVTVQYWAEDKAHHVANHAAKGGKVILSPMMSAYCDYPHAFIFVKSLHSLDVSPAELPKESVIGTECLVWTEYIRDVQYLESRAWPRFCANAEAGWCGSARPTYEDFCERLRVLFPVFAQYGINATPEKGWSPSMEEGMDELLSFKSNFTDDIRNDYRKAQEDV